MKTYSAKPADVNRVWYVVDAADATLGRLSTQVAVLLTGKNKPQFTKHIDTGDYVVVVNAANLRVTGDKLTSKKYYHHSGFPGGLRERSLAEQLKLDPTKVIEHAVRGMLPVNKLRDDRLARLKIYAGAEHQHEAQKPEHISLKLKEGK
jgi:large subunit ribosomal protein L13